MESFTLDQARDNLDRLVSSIIEGAEPATVTTPSGETVVVVSLADFNGWKETAYLLGSSANAAHLRQSIADAESGNSKERRLIQ